MSLHSNLHSESGRSEQIISQFLLKSLHTILDSRIPSLHPSDQSGGHTFVSRATKRDKWFNLALGDRPTTLDNLNFWHKNVMDPMVIDVILVRDGATSSSAVGDLYTMSGARMETVIERWVVQYESLRTVPQPCESHTSFTKIYKKSIILLRALYSTLRLLPANKIFRLLSSSNQAYTFDLNYKVSTFSEPFSRAEEEEMKRYGFVPVETPLGRLCISVTYRSTLSDMNLEASTSLPPQIITDYVGSPAADPLRVFPSSERGIRATSFPLKGIRSPNFTPFQRPHSWTSGLHRAAVPLSHSPLSVSPTYPTPPMVTDFYPSPPDVYGQRFPSHRAAHKKGMSFDEYRPSSPLSVSPSPSPPSYLSGGNLLHNRLCSESSPVSIPLPITGKSPRYLTHSSSDPNKSFLPPPSPRSTKADLLSQESPSESKSFRRGDFYSTNANLYTYSSPKAFKDSKEDSGRFSGVISSCGSPRIGFSRSSSRLSLQDDLDDCEFACPFAVDDVDTSDYQTRKEAPESAPMFQSTVRKSQDAAVGMLVQMLRTAAPLGQDQSYSCQASKSELDGEVGASGFFMSRKAADALEELRSYREIKDLLLSQSGTQQSTK